MQPRHIPTTPGPRPKEDVDTDMSMASPSITTPLDTSVPSFTNRNPTSPVRFATTTNAFGLSASPTSSTSSQRDTGSIPFDSTSPPSAGTVPKRKMRRPSMLSLAQTATFSSTEDIKAPPHTSIPHVTDPSSSKAPAEAMAQRAVTATNPFDTKISPAPRWATSTSTPFLTNSLLRRTSSAPPLALEALRTQTPPIGERKASDAHDTVLPLRWLDSAPSSAEKGKGKEKMQDQDMDDALGADESLRPPPQFSGRPLPASLLATLISESAPQEHEMRSEARLQRLLSSHPKALPLTPRPPRANRGRFPETADDDDDDDSGNGRWTARWMNRGGSSDSDSDDMPMEDPAPEPVNFAFASAMDMDRPASSSSSYGVSKTDSNGGASSVGQAQRIPTPPSQAGQWPKSSARMSFGSAGAGMVPSPGTGFGLPGAFGGLGMGGGAGTPLASPTVERLELATSPTANIASPSLMQYRESQGGSATVRPGKRKAAAQDDRFDPYKRPRGSSPSISASPAMAMSPSRTTSAIPIPQSPGHAPIYPSALSNVPGSLSIPARANRTNHPYTRPMASRSRAASPALSIGSTSGVLSSSLGNNGATPGGRPSFSLGQAFVPTGAGSNGLVPQGTAPQGLGGLGLLSLNNLERRHRENSGGASTTGSMGGTEMLREDSDMSRDAMEED